MKKDETKTLEAYSPDYFSISSVDEEGEELTDIDPLLIGKEIPIGDVYEVVQKTLTARAIEKSDYEHWSNKVTLVVRPMKVLNNIFKPGI